MLDYLKELMLREYFISNATIGKLLDDKKAYFRHLGHIFLLTEDEINNLYELTLNEEIEDIVSIRDYRQYQRIKQYFAIEEIDHHYNDEVEELISLKGNSIEEVLRYEMLKNGQNSRLITLENVTRAAESGAIPAINLFSILLLEGLIYSKDTRRGLNMVHMSADWNSEEGLLIALYYDEENHSKYLYRLHERFLSSGHKDAFLRVKEKYGDHECKGEKEFMFLEQAFRQRILKRNVYDKAYARLLYSDMLNNPDKKNILLNYNERLFLEASNLPLNLNMDFCKCDLKALDFILPNRVDEKKKITIGLSDIERRITPSYRPLCFVSESNYLLEEYAQMICASLSEAHIERIEVSDLASYDLEPSINNIFIRNCDEDAPNAYLIFLRDRISDDIFNLVDNFLLTSHRNKFHLNTLGITLDLSMILPICFASKEHAKKLKDLCTIIEIATPSKKEKSKLIDNILNNKSAIYRINHISIEENAKKRLLDYLIDDIAHILDLAISEHRDETLKIDEALLEPYFKNARIKHETFGFGGIN